MAVDAFAALGLDQPPAGPPPPPPAGDTMPTVTVRAQRPAGGAADPFQSLGILPDSYKPTATLPDWARDGGQPAPQVTPAPDTSSASGIFKAVPSGLYAGVAALPNAPTYAINALNRVLTGLTGQKYGQMTPPIDVNPTGYEPHGTPERATYAGAEAVGSLPGMALGGELAMPLTRAGSVGRTVAEGFQVPMGAPSVAAAGENLAARLPGVAQAPVRGAADMASALPIGATSQAVGAGAMAGQAASETVPPEYAPLANLAGNLGVGLGVGAVQQMVPAAARAAGNRLGTMHGLAPVHERGGAGVALALIAEHAGEHVGGGLGGPAAIAALAGKHLWSAMRQTGARRVADLQTEVLLHPTTVGRELLAARLRPDGSVAPIAQRRIAAALQGSMVAGLAQQVRPQQRAAH